MSKISDQLKNYGNKHPKKHIKHTFFNELAQMIEAKNLSLETLTKKLFKLSAQRRIELFATRFGITSPENGDAAELIITLYRALGAKLNDATIKAMVSGERLSKTQTNKLLDARYEQWRKAPFDSVKRSALEHELKVSLELDLTSPQNKDKALAVILLGRWQKNHFGTLGLDLQNLINKAPQYAPQLIENLYGAAAELKVADDYIKRLIDSIEKDESLFTLSALIQSHPVLVTHWIMKKPEDYFKLSEPMQVAVLRILEHTAAQSDNTLNDLAQFTLDKIAISANSVAGLEEALLDDEVRQDSSYGSKSLPLEIYRLVEKEATRLIEQDTKSNALRVIEEYISLQPSDYKRSFFQNLAKDIRKKGISINLLQQHLGKADEKELFSKWSGLANSRAARVMASLYAITSLDKTMSAKQIKKMVYEKRIEIIGIEKKVFIENKIKDVIAAPHQTRSSHLTKHIGEVYEEMQAKAAFTVNNQHKQQRAAEAIYQKYVLEQGLILANQQAKPAFDPQGHVLLFVALKEGDYVKILAEMKQKRVTHKSPREQVEALLGSTITNPTLCNLDIKHDEGLNNKFKKWLGNDVIHGLLINSPSRSSITPLQDEMAMHVLLSLRVLESKVPSAERKTELRNQLLIEINGLVQKAFRDALKTASKDGTVDLVILNKELDKAREDLATKCREKLVKLVFTTYPDIDWEHELAKLKKHDFTSTTATGLDYLHSDARNETVVRVSATDQTAHDKKIGAKTQAFRILYRNHYQPDGTVTPCATQTLEARVPSIADKNASSRTAIHDVAEKLKHDHRLLRRQAAHSNGPMIYNLLTSLTTAVYDITPFKLANKQRLSADYILQGAHLYNLKQMKAGDPKALAYVQNIPVNQHTNPLDDYAFDDVTAEATIMTDIALLSTLRHYAGVFPSEMQQNLDTTYSFAHKKYLSFLPQIEKGEAYFHKTKSGEIVRDVLRMQKKEWCTVPLISYKSDSLNSLAAKALFKMYSQNEHRNKQFGMLAQTLSVFVESMSMEGCKSANERYQGVSGRVELLKSIDARPDARLSDEEKNVKKALRHVIHGTGSFADLQKHLDIAYNRHDLHGVAAGIGYEDQGAGSKVVATQNKSKLGVISEFDTNVAETGYLNKLHQSSCSAMQSHKANLPEIYQKLFHQQKEATHGSQHSMR